MPNQNKFDLSSFAPAEGDEVLVESTPRKKEGRFDLSLFPESARPKVQPPVPESPYDDSLLGTGKRMFGNLVTFAGGIPKGLETNIQAGVALAQILENNPELAAQREQATQEALRASGYTGGDLADRVSKGAERFTQETLGAKPGTPINFKTLGEASLGKKVAMLTRGTAEILPITLANLGLTLANPAMGTAAIYLAETGSTKTALEELGKAGYDQDTQALAAVGAGAFKTVLEKVGLESLMKAPTGSGIKQKLFKVLTAALSEGSTETLQELTDVVTEAGGKASQTKDALATFGQELSLAVPRLQEAGILGTLSGGTIAGGVEALRIPGERTQAKKAEQEKSIQTAEEEARLVEQAKTARENLKVQSERESLLDRLQKERDLEVGGALVGANERGFRTVKAIDEELSKATDPEQVRALEFERELTVERRAGEKRTPPSPFVIGRKEGSEREFIVSERKAGKKLSEVNAQIQARYQTFDEFMGDLPVGSRLVKNKRVFEKVGDKDWAQVENGRVSPEKKIEERRLTDAEIVKGFELPKPPEAPKSFSQTLEEKVDELRKFDLTDFKPAPVEKPAIPPSERQTRAQSPGVANAKSFNSALDDFLKIEKETKGKPLSEQMTVAKQRLEEKGYHPAIVDELANPERLKRPDLEGDLVEATTREGRIKRAVEPPPELKGRVDAVAKRTKEFRDAEADYLQARKDIFSEVEKLGGKIIAQGEDGTFKIEIKPGKTKLSMQDQLALVKLRQEAAEAGAYSLATVGKGFEIAAAPLRIKQGETLKGDLNQKVSEFISRKNAFQSAKKGADAAKKALLDSYTDFYFKNKVEGKPNASLIGRADDIPVEVQLRRKASSPVPDTAVIDPTTGKTWAERLRDERKEAQKRSEALGPQGEPYVETRKVGTARAEAEKAAGTSFFDIRTNLSEGDRVKWDNINKRVSERIKELPERLDAGLLDYRTWRDIAEHGYYVSKALGNATKGKAAEFGAWSERMIKELGEKIKPALKDLWAEIKSGFKPEMKQTETKRFKDWFGKSKVVDEKNNPQIVYRGEASGSHFDVFDRKKTMKDSGFFFAFNEDQAKFYSPEGKPRQFYLKMEKPLDLREIDYLNKKQQKLLKDFKQEYDEWIDHYSGEEIDNIGSYIESGLLYDYEGTGSGERWNALFKMAEANGFDGVLINDVTDGVNAPIALVFKPEQIKSATGNFGTFSKSDLSITDAKARSLLDFTQGLSEAEVAALNASRERLKLAKEEYRQELSGSLLSPTIPINPKAWKEYVEIGHLVAKGLARNLGEKAKITFENFREAFKNAVGPDIFKRLESNLVHLWEQVKALPDDWESGDEVPTIVRAEAVENTSSPSNVAKARFDFGLPLLDRLERSNSVGGEIGAKWRKAHGILKTTLGRNAVEIRKIAKEAGVRRDKTTPHLDVVSRQLGWEKKGANLVLVELINHPERIKDYPLTEVEKKIISLYRSTYERNEKEIARRLGREPNPLKFQPTLNNEAREAIFVLKGGPLFEALAKATAERSGLELKKVKQKFASGNLSGLDIPTHVPLKGNLIAVGSADAISALQAQNFEFARTLGLLRTFGPKWKNEIKNLREKYDQAGGDLEIFDLIEQGYRGLRPKDWISEKQSSRNLASRLYFRAVDPVFSALALSKSAYMQITQPFIDLQNVGVKNFMKTITEGFGGKLSADDLERMGIISRDILNWKFAEGEKIEDYGRMISALTNRGDLMYAVSLLNDVVSASNWRNFVNSLEGKKLTAKDRQTLRTNLGLTEAEIQKVEQGKFKDPFGENPATPEEEFFVEMVRRGKTQSQHTGKFGGEKSKFQTGSTSPFFLRFQNYTIGEFQRWRRETANLERALKSGDKSERNAAIGRVLKLVGTTAVQGELINIIRHTIKGEWDESEEGSAVGQALKGDYAQATKNFLWNFAEAGFMGAFTRAYFAYQIAQGSATALMDAFFPTNIVHQLWDAVFSRGRYADKDKSERFLEFIESRVPATDLSKPIERAMAITALAKEDHIAIDAARRHYFKWLEDTGRAGEIPEKSGYKESRASVARAYAAMKRGDDEDVLEALATAFQAKLKEGTPKKKKLSQEEALDFVKKSLEARMLLSRHKRAEMEELEKTIGEERYKRLAHHDALLKHLANSLSISKLRTQTKE